MESLETDGTVFPMDESAYIEATQGYADAVCHYRNLAIRLGATTEFMLNNYDRWLCEKGATEAEDEDWVQAADREDWQDNERLRSQLHSTCAAFGHLWPSKRPKRNPRNVRCSACGMYLWALNRNGNEEFTDV